MNDPGKLIDAFLDDELSPAQEAELREWLTTDREHVRAFVAATDLHRSLRIELLAQKVLPLEPVLSRPTEKEFAGVLFGATGVLSPAGTRREIGSAPRPFRRPGVGRFIRRRGALLALAASLVLFIGLSVWLFPSVNNEPTLAISMETRVTLERDGQSLQAQDGMRLLPGDLLRISGSNGAAITYGAENTRVMLKDDTELRTLAWQKGKRFELRQGKLEAAVARQRPFGPMVLLTGQAEVRVLGTRFNLAASTNTTRLDVTEGKVRLTRTSDGEAVKVPAGHYAVAANGVELAALPSTGRISREVWTNYPGAFVAMMTSDPVVSERPNDWEYLTHFETPTNPDSRFGQRVRGYLHPPITGDYRFSIDVAGLGEALLFLSLDEHPENRTQIHFDETRPKLAMSDRAAEPALVTLVAGRRYYIEALHESVTGRGQFKVRWRGPSREREVIPGEFLSPPESQTKGRNR